MKTTKVKKQPFNLYKVVKDFIEANGECTTAKVYAGVGHLIPMAAGASAGRRTRNRPSKLTRYGPPSTPKPERHLPIVDLGRRIMVSDALSQLAREGRLVRVRYRTYAPKVANESPTV